MRTTSHCISAIVLVVLMTACSSVPLTGRRQLSLIPSSQIQAMSYQQYSAFLTEHPVAAPGEDAAMVSRVGERIQVAVESYLQQKGMSDLLDGYAWEFNLVEDEQVNAWCMPGGKVVVYSGLLPVAGDETGLAVVMGHEIAHAIARHGDERMSQSMLREMGGLALQAAVDQKPEETRALWMTAYGLGSELGVMLPFSRLHESEADQMGLMFMAMAGYNPEAAISFWERMAAAKGGAAPPEFLSTHPADATRVANLRKLLPEAMAVYRR